MTALQLASKRDSRPDVTDALTAPRRRFVVSELSRADGAVALDDLARGVLARERATTAEPVDRGDVRACKLSLYHAHLPKLDDAGIVDFDPDDRIATLEA